jgi:hypothetical protein
MAKKSKAQAPKSVAAKDLEPKDVKDVKGGKSAILTTRKAGGSQQDYLQVTMEDVLVSSY